MPEGQVLEFARVTKRFGAVTAVSDLSVRVEPGVVTGFLGPNGAGKTTTLRMLLGQIRPTSGTATIGGTTYAELRHPLRTIGAVLEEAAYRPRRTAARQLMIAAKANGIPAQRVDEVLRLVGLQDDADTRIGGFSLGMRQRLSVATALLGDPGALVLDEPANGLDPEGIRWMRMLMRRLADEGRTVLVSSHVLSEIEQVADAVVVLSKGRAVYSGSIDDLADPTGGAVIVDAEDRASLAAALTAAGLSFDVLRSGLTVRESDAASVGAVAASAGIALSTLQQRGPSLEEVFLDLVYGRRADSPRLDEVANPVAHAPHEAAAETTAGDTALVAGGVPVAGAAAAVGAGLFAATDDQADGAADTDSEPADASEPAPGTPPEDENALGEEAAQNGSVDRPDDADAATAQDEQAERSSEHAPVAGTDASVADEVSGEAEDSALDDDRSDGTSTVADADERADEQTADAEHAAEQPEGQRDDAADAEGHGDALGDGEDRDDDARGASSDELPSEESSNGGSPASAFSVPGDLWAPRPAQEAPEASDDSGPDVLPLATQAVSLPPAADQTTFTELITGIPAATTGESETDDAEPPTTTSAFSVFSPILSEDDDADSTVDDEDDPRLAAMRTSLSTAASRFFGGPAPEYPYGDVPPADEAKNDERATDVQPAEREPSEGEPFEETDDATRAIETVPGGERAESDQWAAQHPEGHEGEAEHHEGEADEGDGREG